jgi:hypothetical protein
LINANAHAEVEAQFQPQEASEMAEADLHVSKEHVP